MRDDDDGGDEGVEEWGWQVFGRGANSPFAHEAHEQPYASFPGFIASSPMSATVAPWLSRRAMARIGFQGIVWGGPLYLGFVRHTYQPQPFDSLQPTYLASFTESTKMTRSPLPTTLNLRIEKIT